MARVVAVVVVMKVVMMRTRLMMSSDRSTINFFTLRWIKTYSVRVFSQVVCH